MTPAVSVARVWHTDLVLVSVRCELVTGKASLTWAGMMRAGDGNRTRMTSLEGWGSTIELRPHNLPASVARLRAPAHQAGRHRQRTGSVPHPAPRAGRMIVGSNFMI